MTEVATIEDDLARARQDLHQTLAQVNQKVAGVGTRLIRPRNLLRAKPVLTIGLAAAAGFAFGSSRNRGEKFAAFAIGLIVGIAFRDRPLPEDDTPLTKSESSHSESSLIEHANAGL
jgi:hypothetical protein